MIVSARYTDNGLIEATLSNGNRRYSHSIDERLQDWLDQGNTIAQYSPPPPPTDDERIDEAFPQTDVARVIFEALFELTNRVIALEGGAAVTRAQLRTWLRNKLP